MPDKVFHTSQLYPVAKRMSKKKVPPSKAVGIPCMWCDGDIVRGKALQVADSIFHPECWAERSRLTARFGAAAADLIGLSLTSSKL